MDAAAYLKTQGWRGEGHSLDHTDRGIKKPLLVSKKIDVLGLGQKKHNLADQWWMRAFDSSLRDLGSGKQSTLDRIAKNGVARGGLYGFFVRGEGLEATLSDSATSIPQIESANITPGSPFASTTTPGDSLNPESTADSSSEVTSDLETSSSSDSEADTGPDNDFSKEHPVTVVMHPDRLARLPNQSSFAAQAAKAQPFHTHDTAKVKSQSTRTTEPGPHVNGSIELASQSNGDTSVATTPGTTVSALGKKRRREEESREEKRARRKAVRSELARQNAIRNREQAIADGTWDYAEEERRRKEREITKTAHTVIQQKFPDNLREAAKEEAKARTRRKGIKPDISRYTVNVKGTKTLEKVSLRAQKHVREQAERETEQAERARLTVPTFPGKAPSRLPEDATREEHVESEKDQEGDEKHSRRERVAKEQSTMEGGEAVKPARRPEKAARSAEKVKHRRETAEAQKNSKEDMEAAQRHSHPESAQMHEDEVKLSVSVKGREKKISGVGRTEKYPSKAEKQANEEAACTPVGKHLAKHKPEREAKKAKERQELINVKATERGILPEEYVKLRQERKYQREVNRAGKLGITDTRELLPPGPNGDLFIVDLSADPMLLDSANVKDISREQRLTRKEKTREAREARAAAPSIDSLGAKERNKDRT